MCCTPTDCPVDCPADADAWLAMQNWDVAACRCDSSCDWLDKEDNGPK